jgi:hypothetical protein
VEAPERIEMEAREPEVRMEDIRGKKGKEEKKWEN